MSDITIEQLSKSFFGRPPVRALDSVDLTIESGSIVAILGRSGCGKTTLLRTIAGFERPDAGRIHFGQTEVASARRSLPPEKRNVGIVPQEGALFPHLDVEANIAFALRDRRSTPARRRVAELLDTIGLSGFERRRPHELSGGQQQRVALARALAPRPAVLLLDEPFTALDSNLRTQLRSDVVGIVRREGATVLIVSHDPGEAMSMADTIAVMRDGRIVQTGTGEIYRHPVDAETASMLGEVTAVSGMARGHHATTALGDARIEGEWSGPVRLLLRPEQIVVHDGMHPNGTVTSVQFHGRDVLLSIRIGPDEVLARWPAGEEHHPTGRWRIGDQVALRIAGPPIWCAPAGQSTPASHPSERSG